MEGTCKVAWAGPGTHSFPSLAPTIVLSPTNSPTQKPSEPGSSVLILGSLGSHDGLTH
jgi:hypothetical protein